MSLHPKLVPAVSSIIEGYRYDPHCRHLFLAFKGGSAYVYANVEAEKADRFAKSKSLGSFFHKEIRRHYTFNKLTQRDLAYMLRKIDVPVQHPGNQRKGTGVTIANLLSRYPVLGGIF